MQKIQSINEISTDYFWGFVFGIATNAVSQKILTHNYKGGDSISCCLDEKLNNNEEKDIPIESNQDLPNSMIP